jgi:hypothetical protein
MYWKTSWGWNIFYTGWNIGIGKNNPTYLLDINGIINFIGFRMTTGASNNYILASDASGNARWTSTGSLFSSYVETDPLVSAWAKAPTKPSYNFTEIVGTVTDAQVPDTITVNTAINSTQLGWVWSASYALLASPWLTWTPTAPTAATATNTTQIATTAFVNSKVATLLDYQSSRDFPLGTLIQSDIDYSVTNGEPFLLEIQGNAYGSIVPFDIKYQWYIYSDTVINHGWISVWTNITWLVLFNYGGKLCFWFPSQSYWHGYTVNINDSYPWTKKNRLVSITNAAKPGAITKEVALSANIRQWLHSSNYNSYAPTLTWWWASWTWGINITGNSENVTTPTWGYKHLWAWWVGRTAIGAILVNTAYMADSATTAWTANAVSFNGWLTTGSTPTFGGINLWWVMNVSIPYGATPSTNPDATILASFKNSNKSWDPRVLDIGVNSDNSAFLRSVGTNLTLFGGNVGINTKTPWAQLDVNGDIKVWNQQGWDNPGGWNKNVLIDATNHGRFRIKASNYTYGNVDTSLWADSTVTPSSGIYSSHAFSINAWGNNVVIPTGNVGIWINNPSAKFAVAPAAGGGLYVGNGIFSNPAGWNQLIDLEGAWHARLNVRTSNVLMGMYAHDTWLAVSGTTPGGFIGTYNNYPVSFLVNASQKMVIDTAGNVGIWTTWPWYKLDVNGTIRTTGDILVNGNYGQWLVGIYSDTRYQNVFSMWSAYRLATDGTTPGNLYGIAWTHSNIWGQSIGWLGHQALFMENWVTQTAIGNGIWTRAAITSVWNMNAPSFVDSNNAWYYVDPSGTSRMNTLNYVDQAYIVDVRPQYMYDWNDSAYYMDFNNTSRLNALIPNNIQLAWVGWNSNVPNQSYGIYQEAGAWVHPYPDLNIWWHTWIKIWGYYGYWWIRFFNNSDMATETMSIGNWDNNVRVANDLYVNGVVTSAAPTAANHVATKAYVDAAAGWGSLKLYQANGTSLIGNFINLLIDSSSHAIIYYSDTLWNILQTDLSAQGSNPIATNWYFPNTDCTLSQMYRSGWYWVSGVQGYTRANNWNYYAVIWNGCTIVTGIKNYSRWDHVWNTCIPVTVDFWPYTWYCTVDYTSMGNQLCWAWLCKIKP